MLKSICVSAFIYNVQLIWAHNWIGHEKLPQIDPLHVEIHQMEPKLQQVLCLGQLFCSVFSWFEITVGLALKEYPKLTHHKLKSFHLESWINIRYLPNHTKPNQTRHKLFLWGGNLIVINFYPWYFLDSCPSRHVCLWFLE